MFLDTYTHMSVLTCGFLLLIMTEIFVFLGCSTSNVSSGVNRLGLRCDEDSRTV